VADGAALRPGLAVRNKRITTATITARGFVGIPIDHQSIEHGMMQASHFVFNDKNGTIALGVNDFFEADLMIANFFRDQPALLQISVRTGKD